MNLTRETWNILCTLMERRGVIITEDWERFDVQ